LAACAPVKGRAARKRVKRHVPAILAAMLTWLACQFAPRIRDLHETAPPPLPEPSRHNALAERMREAAAALAAVPFTPRTALDAHRILFALGCRDLVTSEADQHPDTAGRTPNWAPFPEFQEVEVPGADGVRLRGRHNPGAPGAPTLILVHGLFDSHVRRYVVEYGVSLARMGFHVVALDLRDHGRLRGQGPPPSLGIHEGRDLLAAAQALSDKEGVSVGILGFSYGGHCAVRAAHEATLAGRPDALRGGVLALSAPLHIQEAVCALDDHTRLPPAHGFVQRFMRRGLLGTIERHLTQRIHEKGRLSHPVYDFESYIREIVLPAYPELPNLVGALLGAARCTQPMVLSKLAVPVAIVHATDDFLVPVQHLRDAAREAAGNAWVVTRELPAGSHVGFGVVDPQGTLGLLAAWFGTLRDG
jgi:alpha-beta hydrolase superfamily lysophospholipase